MKKRNPNISFILSIAFSGLGQVYNGELMKGILYLVLIFPLYILIGLSGLISTYSGLIIITVIIILYKLAVATEAYRRSSSLNPYEIKPINKIGNYLLFIVFSFIVIWAGLRVGKTLIGYEAFEIPTPSMEPSIKVGDRIMATRVKAINIEIGDIVTFTRDDGQIYLSRVIGLPGDNIEVKDDKAIINGQKEIWEMEGTQNDDKIKYEKYKVELPNGKFFGTLKMKSLNGIQIPKQELSDKEGIVIEEGRIYVLGDNRNNSMDSRIFGTIPLENVDKKAYYVWWSNYKKRIGIKLDGK